MPRIFALPAYSRDPVPVEAVGRELVGPFGVVPFSEEVVCAPADDEDLRDADLYAELLREYGYRNASAATQSQILKGAFQCV